MKNGLLSAIFCFCVLFFPSGLAWTQEEEITTKIEVSEEEEIITQIDCEGIYDETKVCPEEMCYLRCSQRTKEGKCINFCEPRECFEIDREHCPLDRCQILIGCNDKEVCYDKNLYSVGMCGNLASPWQDEECCEGLVKRCGVEFFDGSCDMVGKYTVHSVPICIPCGNGICNQFENRCNCPEDCR